MTPIRFLLLTLLCIGTATAADQQEDALEAQVRDIAKNLRCAVCQNQPVYESNSDLAKDMLKLIRDKLAAGESPAAVKQYFHDRYGDYIYLEPPAAGRNWIIWIAPFAGLLLGAVALWRAMRRWQAKPAGTPTTTPTADAAKKRIQQELDKVDV
ncbi:MAG: cytochrome c-type biogenesis protein CcmH [Magnetococcales bacterium]|nr:cytochrome c-type biogenesis protein CcmH [Magnetococcales bacterium]